MQFAPVHTLSNPQKATILSKISRKKYLKINVFFGFETVDRTGVGTYNAHPRIWVEKMKLTRSEVPKGAFATREVLMRGGAVW